MSPSTVPVVCRATSGAQSPSSGGVMVLHQASRPAKATAKTASAARLRLGRMNSAAIVAKPEDARTGSPRPLSSPSGPGSRNQSAMALHALTGAMTTIATTILRASPAALFTMTNLAPLRPRRRTALSTLK